MKPYLLIAMPLVVTGIAVAIAYCAGGGPEAIAGAVAIGVFTLLVVGGGTYLGVYTSRMRQLDLRQDELAEGEVLWARTTHAVHYKTGNALKFWQAVGGKLFLTSDALEFRANPAEFWVYRIKIPLGEIHAAKRAKVFALIPGGLRIERLDGTFELFTFGAAFDVSTEWANAILDFRDDLIERS